MWDSAVVGAGCRVWLVWEGFCSPSCRLVHTCGQFFLHPCRASSVFVSVDRCTIITGQECNPGTAVGAVVCSLDCRFKVKTVLLNSIKSTQLNTIDFN